MTRYLAIALILLSSNSFVSSNAFASECGTEEQSENLILDQSIPLTEIIRFPNDDRILPDKSDFEIIHAITMSNEKGERWATLTVENKSSGRRTINEEHVMGLFADGTRRFPERFDYTFDRREVSSITVRFGCSKFPILELTTRS